MPRLYICHKLLITDDPPLDLAQPIQTVDLAGTNPPVLPGTAWPAPAVVVAGPSGQPEAAQPAPTRECSNILLPRRPDQDHSSSFPILPWHAISSIFVPLRFNKCGRGPISRRGVY